MQDADSDETPAPVRRAIGFRDGLMIALLAARPLRRRNLAAIVIGTNLLRTGNQFWLRFVAGETKNRRPIDVPLPVELTPFMERYLDVHRPALLDGSNAEHLWVSSKGRPMSIPTIYGRIMKLTRDEFGVGINPHLFRDCAATSVAVDDPDHVRISAALLGHCSLSTTQRYYDQSRMLAAGRRYQQQMMSIRRQARRWITDGAAKRSLRGGSVG